MGKHWCSNLVCVLGFVFCLFARSSLCWAGLDLHKVMASAKRFYGKKTSHHRFMESAIDQVLEDDSSSAADIILIGPPQGGYETDQEEENEENVPDNGLPNEVSSELVVHQEDNDEVIDENEEDNDDEEEEVIPQKKRRKGKPISHGQSSDVPSSSKGNAETKKKKEKKVPVKWTKRHIKQQNEPASDQDRMAQEVLLTDHPDLVNMTVWSSFELVCDELLDLLTEQTNIYGTRDKNKANFSVSKEEMANFVGLLSLSGYNIRKSQKDYWSIDPDLGCNTFRETMSRNRFNEIKSCIHVADNNSLDPNTRMAKVKPLYDLLDKIFSKFGVFHESLSVDESMVPYYGRHSCKQFIKAKPIRFGFKLWVLASSTGLPYHVHIYEGKPAEKSEETLGSRVVKRALATCENPKVHSVFFDIFFSSYKLLVDLNEKGFRATGTMRNDRIEGCPLSPVNDMKKSERGHHNHRSSTDNIEIVRWNDNSVVTVGSNAYGLMPLGQVKRWKKGKGQISVEQPAVIRHYNKGMGGVDLVDRALSDFRPSIHGKKWYWPLLVNGLNLAFVFSWRFYRIITGESIEQKLYRRQVVSILIRRSTPITPANHLPAPTVYKVADEIRLDGQGHYPEAGPVGRKCAVCRKSCRNTCGKCKRSMHVKNCFQQFHEK